MIQLIIDDYMCIYERKDYASDIDTKLQHIQNKNLIPRVKPIIVDLNQNPHIAIRLSI